MRQYLNPIFSIILCFSLGFGLNNWSSAHSKEQKSNCSRQLFNTNSFLVCEFDVENDNIAIRWKGSDGKPLGSLAKVKSEMERSGQSLVFAMNGGMYHEDLSPVGYYVENGKKLRNAITRRGPGNFHMMPNGIFYVENKRAGVMETRAFLRRNKRPNFATQSGPMLVINNRIHPIFKPASNFKKRRNAVGVSKDGGRVYFAISERPLTFYSIAEFFQKKLRTPNALYLDGGYVPQMMAFNIAIPSFAPIGPIVVVTRK